MKRIEQVGAYDCGVACIAMYAGRKYEEVLKLVTGAGFNFHKNKGLSGEEIMMLLRSMGYRPIQRWYFNELEPAIVLTNSLKRPLERMHSVCWNPESKEFVDPSRGRRYGRDVPLRIFHGAIQDIRITRVQAFVMDEISELSKCVSEAMEEGFK